MPKRVRSSQNSLFAFAWRRSHLATNPASVVVSINEVLVSLRVGSSQLQHA